MMSKTFKITLLTSLLVVFSQILQANESPKSALQANAEPVYNLEQKNVEHFSAIGARIVTHFDSRVEFNYLF